MAAALKTETLIVLGVGLAVLVMGKLAADKAGQVADSVKNTAQELWTAASNTVGAVVPYVNPADERNVVNQGAQSLYQATTGSTGTIGGDLYDATHTGALRDVNWWEMANPATAVGAVAGTGISDSIKSWWNSL